MKNQISYADFEQLEILVGTIIQAEVFAEARKPAYRLLVDFGARGILKSSAQITKHYSCGELVGKQVIGVTNFPTKQIGPLVSECLVTGFADENGDVILATPDKLVPNGSRLF